MESTIDDITEKGNERLEQDTENENEKGNQSQDNAQETENMNPRETVGEVASAVEHHDSLCPMVVEEGISFASQTDCVAIETGTKDDGPPKADDGPPKTDDETTHVDKNAQLENSQILNPSPSTDLEPDKGLVNPTVEALAEQTEVSSQENIDIFKDGGDSDKVGGNSPAVHDKMVPEPDFKPSEENVKELVEPDAEMLMDVDKASEEPDSKTPGDHKNDQVMSVTETVKENDIIIGDPDTVNSAGSVSGLVDHYQETATDHDKGTDVVGSDTLLNHENEPSLLDVETTTDLGKGLDLPCTDSLTDIYKTSDVLVTETPEDHGKGLSDMPATENSSDNDKAIATQEVEPREDIKDEVPDFEMVALASVDSITEKDVSVEPATDSENRDNSGPPQGKDGDGEDASMKHDNSEPGIPCVVSSDAKSEERGQGNLNNGIHKIASVPPISDGTMNLRHSFLLDDMSEGYESGTEEEQSAFMKELENFFRERNMEFKPPKFYGEGLNCLKLWRAVTRLGGYDKVTACKLWRQVGESFRPPKTCTTVSWTFRGFYEKALFEYERYKVNGGELQIPLTSNPEPMNIDNQASGSGRARRDAAARAMQGWHSQRLLGNGEVSDSIIKDKGSVPQQKREKQIGTPGTGLLKRKRPVSAEHGANLGHTQVSKPLLDVTVVDVGPPAEWVKINVQRTKDCFEVYALVPGLLREEVQVQSDPAGRLVISGEPENPDNLWGATSFKKVISLPERIDPHHTSAVVTLNGQLYVRVPLEQSD